MKHPGLIEPAGAAMSGPPAGPASVPARRRRWSTLPGYAISAAVHAVLFAALLVRWQASVDRMMVPDDPVFMTMDRPAAPPEPVREVAPGPQQVERQRAPSEPLKPPPVRPPPGGPPAETAPAAPPTKPADPRPPASQTTAPPSQPAPPAPQPASNVRDSWQGRLLAHLEKHRRYPANARSRRTQGITHVRFRMNRAGAVLQASVLRSSGSGILDQAALDTLRRAQPLPGIPEGMPDEIELAVPVEFFLR